MVSAKLTSGFAHSRRRDKPGAAVRKLAFALSSKAPRGTGALDRFGEGDIANKLRLGPPGRVLAVARDPVDADVRAGLDPCPANHLWPANGRDENIGSGHRRREIARARMGDRHGRIAAKQRLGDRLSAQIGAAGDDSLGPRKINAECRIANSEKPGVAGCRPSTSLPGEMASTTRPG